MIFKAKLEYQLLALQLKSSEVCSTYISASFSFNFATLSLRKMNFPFFPFSFARLFVQTHRKIPAKLPDYQSSILRSQTQCTEHERSLKNRKGLYLCLCESCFLHLQLRLQQFEILGPSFCFGITGLNPQVIVK